MGRDYVPGERHIISKTRIIKQLGNFEYLKGIQDVKKWRMRLIDHKCSANPFWSCILNFQFCKIPFKFKFREHGSRFTLWSMQLYLKQVMVSYILNTSWYFATISELCFKILIFLHAHIHTHSHTHTDTHMSTVINKTPLFVCQSSHVA